MATSPGKDLFELKCVMCHEPPVTKAMAGGNWPGRINEIIEFSDLSDKERSTLLEYIQSLIDEQRGYSWD